MLQVEVIQALNSPKSKGIKHIWVFFGGGAEILVGGFLVCVFWVFFFLLFRAAPMAYVSSQARGRIEAIAACLCHSHSNKGSEPCLQLQHSSQQPGILNPLSEARDETRILMDPSRVH